MKHIKLFENFINEGTRQITEPVILLAIHSKSAEDFKNKLKEYKVKNPKTYTEDVLDAQFRLDLPLNVENDPALIYNKTEEISVKEQQMFVNEETTELTKEVAKEMYFFLDKTGNEHGLVAKYKGKVSDDDIDGIISSWATTDKDVEDAFDDYWSLYSSIKNYSTNESAEKDYAYYKELVDADKKRYKNSTGGESEMNYQNLAYNRKMMNRAKAALKKMGKAMTKSNEGYEVQVADMDIEAADLVNQITDSLDFASAKLYDFKKMSDDIKIEYPELSKKIADIVEPMMTQLEREYPVKLKDLLKQFKK